MQERTLMPLKLWVLLKTDRKGENSLRSDSSPFLSWRNPQSLSGIRNLSNVNQTTPSCILSWFTERFSRSIAKSIAKSIT